MISLNTGDIVEVKIMPKPKHINPNNSNDIFAIIIFIPNDTNRFVNVKYLLCGVKVRMKVKNIIRIKKKLIGFILINLEWFINNYSLVRILKGNQGMIITLF